MVGQLTYGKRQWESLDGQMRKLIPAFDAARQDMLTFVDADTNAFNDYMKAMKMPRSNEGEIKARNEAMQQGLKEAVQVPLALATKAARVFSPLEELAQIGNINCKSDLQASV